MIRKIYLLTAVVVLTAAASLGVSAQAQESFSGTVLSYGTGADIRTRTSPFTLNIKGATPDSEAARLLSILQEAGQDKVLDEIRGRDLGNFALTGGLGRDLNVVRESMVDGKRRIFIAFERWTQFGELRSGYRSLDYPFGVIELYIDPHGPRRRNVYRAAKVRWHQDKKSGQYEVEIENFATFPAKLLNVRSNRTMR